MRFGLKRGLIRAKQQMNKQYIHMTYFPLVKLVQGEYSHLKIAKAVYEEGIDRVLLVTDENIQSLGLLDQLVQQLEYCEVEYRVYSAVQSKPTVQDVEAVHCLYLQEECQGFIALGGGSVIDCCKVAALMAKNPYSVGQLAKMNALSKENKLSYAPPVFVAPTTAGSGSEVSPRAVITDRAQGEKLTVFTNKFMPRWVAIDPVLQASMPRELTANTGVAALSCAVESYIGVQSTPKSKKYAERAVGEIFTALPRCYSEPGDLRAREMMGSASMYAAMAARIGGEGYAYALGNCVDTQYELPYGFSNGVALPWVLEFCFDRIFEPLAELAVLSGVVSTGEITGREDVAREFIEQIKELNTGVFIPKKVSQLTAQDIPVLAKKTAKLAGNFCSATCLLDQRECEELLTHLLPGTA